MRDSFRLQPVKHARQAAVAVLRERAAPLLPGLLVVRPDARRRLRDGDLDVLPVLVPRLPDRPRPPPPLEQRVQVKPRLPPERRVDAAPHAILPSSSALCPAHASAANSPESRQPMNGSSSDGSAPSWT